jgi:cytochrome c-type biogenesis protein CcmH/NrfF
MTDNNFMNSEPGFAERVRTTARETAKTGVEIGEIFGDVADRLGEVVENARRPGKPLDTLSKMTRQAPLGALFVAFVVGMAFARRR